MFVRHNKGPLQNYFYDRLYVCIYIYTYIYICYRLQKRGPIFRFIGSKTGPKFEVEIGKKNNKKTIFPPPVLGCKYMSHEVRF